MPNRSKQLALDEATAGMVLSDDLLNTRGKVILPKGATLTDATLASLRRYDVEMLPILLSEELSAAEQAAEQAHFQQRIASLFRKSGADKTAGLLQQYVSNFRLGNKP